MDAAAVHYAYIQNELITYANFNPHQVTFSFIPVVLVIDLLALFFALFVLLILATNFCCYCKKPPNACDAENSNAKNEFERKDATDCFFSFFLAAIFCFKKLKSSGDDGQNEQKVWLLTIVFVAPFIAFGTHFTYIVIAWIQYPDHAGAISVMYILTFLYLFISFRFLYLCLSDNKEAYSTCCKCVAKPGDIESPPVETADYEKMERNSFKVWKVIPITGIGIVLCCIEFWLIAGLVTLPIAEVIEDAPTYIYVWFRTILVIVTGLITYKLLTFKRPDNTTFLVTLLKACEYLYSQNQRDPDIPSAVTDVEKAAVALSVIMKQHGQRIHTNGESKAQKLWMQTFTNALEQPPPSEHPPLHGQEQPSQMGEAETPHESPPPSEHCPLHDQERPPQEGEAETPVEPSRPSEHPPLHDQERPQAKATDMPQ